jgi:hypothetical protein
MMTGSSPVTCDRGLHPVTCGRGLHPVTCDCDLHAVAFGRGLQPGMTRDGWACAREQT